MNYANKRENHNYSDKDIGKGYMCAMGSSITVALLIRKLLESKTRHMSGPRLVFMNSISSFFACASAAFLNSYCMRKQETIDGIEIRNPETNSIIGKS